MHAFHAVQLIFLYYIIQDPNPGNGPAYIYVGTSYINIIRQSPTDVATDQPDLDNPSFRFFSQVILSCAKLTIKTSHHNHICQRFYLLFSLPLKCKLNEKREFFYHFSSRVLSTQY